MNAWLISSGKWWSACWEPRTAALLFKSTAISRFLLGLCKGEPFPSNTKLIIWTRLINSSIMPLGDLRVQQRSWSIFKLIWSFYKLCCSLVFCLQMLAESVLPEDFWCWACVVPLILSGSSPGSQQCSAESLPMPKVLWMCSSLQMLQIQILYPHGHWIEF